MYPGISRVYLLSEPGGAVLPGMEINFILLSQAKTKGPMAPSQITSVMNEQHRCNKDLVLSFYKDVIGRRDAARAREIIAEGYIQHNPQLKTGRAGVLEALEHLRKMPAPPVGAPSPIKLVIADADLVALLLVVVLGGQKKVVVDIFRVEGGQLAEHWDAVQDEAEAGCPASIMFDEPAKVTDATLTDTNRAVVKSLALEALPGRNHARIHHIIVEGSFAVVQSEISIGQEPFVRYDVLRLLNRKIEAQWSVQQSIPSQMMHSNGMI
jgi:predicted SnoaL-like aldol condensation-catalyzing enzyme